MCARVRARVCVCVCLAHACVCVHVACMHVRSLADDQKRFINGKIAKETSQ